ncbi:MAG: PA14 domain-containing protein, partial [Anaerolineae bacterium]
IFIDGQLRLDAWWDSSFTGHDWGGSLSSGNHEVKIEFYENSGDARLEAWWQGAGYLPSEQGCSAGEWCAEYWGNVDLQGTAFMRFNEGGGVLDHNWGAGGPGTPYGLPGDRFSDRFQRTVSFACGRYRFNVFSDDGVRLWVGNQLLLDQWHPQAASFQVEADLLAGNAVVRVDHYEEAGDAAIHLDWQQISSCTTPTPTITPTPTPLPTFTPTVTPTATVCPDYTPPPGIGVEDIQTIVAHWGETPISPGWEPRFDLNADGRVDIIDVMRTGAVWGTMC